MHRAVGRQCLRSTTWLFLAGAVASSCDSVQTYSRLDVAAAAPTTPPAKLIAAAVPLRAATMIAGAEAPSLATALVAIGDFIVIADRMASPHVRVVSIRDRRVLSHALPHGDGPRAARELSDLVIRRIRGDTAWLAGSDLSRRRSFELLLRPDGVLTVLRADSIHHPVSPNVLQRFATPTGALLFGATSALLVRVDTSARTLAFVRGPLPHDSGTFVTPRGFADANWRRAARRPSTGDIAVAFEHAGRLDLHGPAGDWLYTVATPRAPRLAYRLHPETRALIWLADDRLGFVDVAATDSLIYALYCDCPHSARGAKHVQVFDWSGAFRQEFSLDADVYRIAVTPDDRRLIGIAFSPAPLVLVWDVPLSLTDQGPRHVAQH